MLSAWAPCTPKPLNGRAQIQTARRPHGQPRPPTRRLDTTYRQLGEMIGGAKGTRTPDLLVGKAWSRRPAPFALHRSSARSARERWSVEHGGYPGVRAPRTSRYVDMGGPLPMTHSPG